MLEVRDDAGVAAVMPVLQRHGLLGINERDDVTELYFPRRVDVGIDGEWRPVEDRDWSLAWREGLRPVTVGALTVTPPWEVKGEVKGAGRDVIVIEPGQAFGTGHHETTASALALLQELHVADREVLDVGTGSGLLAIAAHRLGAARVVAVDTDPVAVEVACANVAVNDAVVDVRLGSVEVAAGAFDVVLANLDTQTHRALSTQLLARLAPGGALLAGGISRERSQEALGLYEASGRQIEVRGGAAWSTLVVRRGRE